MTTLQSDHETAPHQFQKQGVSALGNRIQSPLFLCAMQYPGLKGKFRLLSSVFF